MGPNPGSSKLQKGAPAEPKYFKLYALGLTAELTSIGDSQNRMLVLAMGAQDKKFLEEVLAEFREGIAFHRTQGATEERIRQILGEAIWLAFREVEDPAVRAWICEEFNNAARLAPIVTSYPVSLTRH
jgi:hypothetical protein